MIVTEFKLKSSKRNSLMLNVEDFRLKMGCFMWGLKTRKRYTRNNFMVILDTFIGKGDCLCLNLDTKKSYPRFTFKLGLDPSHRFWTPFAPFFMGIHSPSFFNRILAPPPPRFRRFLAPFRGGRGGVPKP